MAKVTRFFYVTSPRSTTVHILVGKKRIEGERTACGRIITTWWRWSTRRARRERVCSQCDQAA